MDKKSIVGFLQSFYLLLGSLQEILYIGSEFIRYLQHRAMSRSLIITSHELGILWAIMTELAARAKRSWSPTISRVGCVIPDNLSQDPFHVPDANPCC